MSFFSLATPCSLVCLLATFNRHVESIEEPGYAAPDQPGRVMGPRVLPLGPQGNDGPRRGPHDPSVPYALLQKKPKPKKPRSEPQEPAIGKRFFYIYIFQDDNDLNY